jgi:hypothetical protein
MRRAKIALRTTIIGKMGGFYLLQEKFVWSGFCLTNVYLWEKPYRRLRTLYELILLRTGYEGT